MKHLNVNDHGTVSVDGSDSTKIDMKGLPWGATTSNLSYLIGASPAVVDVWQQDNMAFMGKYAYVRELSQAFFDLMAADQPLAEDYGVYMKSIEHEVKVAHTRLHQGHTARTLRSYRGAAVGVATRDVPGA